MGQPKITLQYMKRYPATQQAAKWRKKRVHIRHPDQGYWRPQGKGYTMHAWEAWNIPFETALAHCANLNPKDVPLEFVLADMPGNTLKP
jgi:hypothetical protein